MASPLILRGATYMSPDYPVELYQDLLDYLENRLHSNSFLICESRWDGPPVERMDPFENNQIDLAWVTSPSYLKMKNNPNLSLLPVAPQYHNLPNGKGPGNLISVIIHRDLKKTVEYFKDLRGYRWAFNRKGSMIGQFFTLYQLKNMGENANFFSNIRLSGSQINSISMVKNKIADAAAIDANTLMYYLKQHPEAEKELHVLTTWGPIGPHPILIKSSLPEDIKFKIGQTLLHMSENQEGARILAKYKIKRFLPIDKSAFLEDMEIIEKTKNLTFDSVYY